MRRANHVAAGRMLATGGRRVGSALLTFAGALLVGCSTLLGPCGLTLRARLRLRSPLALAIAALVRRLRLGNLQRPHSECRGCQER